MQLLLDHNADAYVRDGRGNTSLHLAARGRTLEVVSILLGVNVDINSRNVDGRTPLHQATDKDVFRTMDSEVIRLLLNHGADVQARDDKGKIASELVRATGNNREELLQLFFQYYPSG